MNKKISIEQVDKFIKNDFSKMSREEVDAINKTEMAEMESQHKKFSDAFQAGNCYLCDEDLGSIKEDQPCIHWLLRKNKRFKKNTHFLNVTNIYGMFQIQCYLRWCANLEKPFANINDLEDEVKHPENFEATIKFENLQWTFSCSNNDLIGHERTSSCFPHYHFQMKINDLPFIKFNDFHIPLSEKDLFNFNLFKKHGEKFKHTFGRGSSIKQVLKNVEPEEIINMSVSGDPGAKSTYHFSNIIFPNEGELLDGSVVADLIKKSKKTGLPIAKLVKEIPNINVSTIISPSDDIPEHNLRDGRGKKK